MKNKKLLSILLASGIALTGCTSAVQNKNTKSETAKTQETQEAKSSSTSNKNEGELAPDFTLKDRDGNEFTLSKQKGKKVYIKFWSSWCHVCIEGMEELNNLFGQKNDFEVVTIVAPGVGSEKSKEEFLKWFDSQPYKNIKILFDENASVTNAYGIKAYPTSVAVGSDGVLVGVQAGHISNDLLKEAFSKIK